jgi:hypothetical protein
MLDLMTMLWICVGVGYSALFVFDLKVLSKRKVNA